MADESRIVKDSFGGYVEHFADGSRFIWDPRGTACSAMFYPARQWLHWHRPYVVKADGKTTYQACNMCAYRKLWQRPGGYAPVDSEWVRTGKWTPTPPVPTTQIPRSAVQPAPPIKIEVSHGD